MQSALILVDIQNDYFPGGHMELVGIDEASAKARGLLSLFRENHWPTFHTQHIATGDSATFLLPDTDGVAIHDSIKPFPNELVIQKHYPNSFLETRLQEELKEAGIERVVICGAMSHMCIDATTRAAADLGFECTVIHDACATKSLKFGGKAISAQEVHGSFMAALGSAYAEVLSFSQFLSRIRGGCTT